jgi:hypothetical protein
VSETFAILAKRGAGKTYAAAVMVEELLKASPRVVVVDPVQSSSWFPLRLCGMTPTAWTRPSHAPVGTTSKSPICRMEAGCDARRLGDRGRYTTKDSRGVKGISGSWGEAKRVG